MISPSFSVEGSPSPADELGAFLEIDHHRDGDLGAARQLPGRRLAPVAEEVAGIGRDAHDLAQNVHIADAMCTLIYHPEWIGAMNSMVMPSPMQAAGQIHGA